MIFFKFYIADFQRDTAHLTLVERGAYLSLLNHHYLTESPLPGDLTTLNRIVGATTRAEKAAVARVLAEFWEAIEGRWINARSCREIESAYAGRETAKRNGQKGGRPIKSTAEITQPVISGLPKVEPTDKPNGKLFRIQKSEVRINPSERLSPDSCVTSSFPANELTRGERENFDRWLEVKAAYPPAPARADWIAAERNANRLIGDGASWAELLAGTQRYATHVIATGRLVLNPARFFGDSDRPWSQPWPIPTSRAERTQAADVAAAIEWAGVNTRGNS